MKLQKLTGLGMILGLTGLLAPSAAADVETFNGLPAGTVICGQLPQGGVMDGSGMFSAVRVKSVANNAGPQSAILFDSANPSVPDDIDLGTPNWMCGGPGFGAGGELGMPGENCQAYGNLVIVAENINDGNFDNMVDFPDDEADGGMIEFEFSDYVSSVNVTIVDIDSEACWVQISNKSSFETVQALPLGDNSIQEIHLSGIGSFRTVRVVFSGSGAVAQIEYFRTPLAVEEESWGSVKARYR